MNTFIIFAILAVVAFIIFAFVFMYQLRTYEKPLAHEMPEAYPYKYQTPFDDKLIELGVKEKWDAAWEEQGRGNADVDQYKGMSFCVFIMASLSWPASKEGFDFWNEISEK